MDQQSLRIRRRPRLGSGKLQRRLEVSLQILESLGVRVPATGRHRKALHLLSNLNAEERVVDLASMADLDLLASAHRIAWETFLITVAATNSREKQDSPFSILKLNECMYGGLGQESQNSPGEDIQFEMYVAASLVLGGLEVRGGEPDLQFLYGYEWVGVAAKRIRSNAPAQLRKHIKKALEQIRRSKMRGFVAVNIDQRFKDIDPISTDDDLSKDFHSRSDEVTRADVLFESNPMALGYLAFGYFTSWHQPNPNTKPKFRFYTPRRWHAWAREPGEELLFKDLYSGWLSRLEKRTDVMSNPTWNGVL